jgi:hypothetical protein
MFNQTKSSNKILPVLDFHLHAIWELTKINYKWKFEIHWNHKSTFVSVDDVVERKTV